MRNVRRRCREDAHRVRVDVGGREIELPVAVEIAGRDRARRAPDLAGHGPCNVPSPRPSSTPTLLATPVAATSSLPSPLRSATATAVAPAVSP